MAKKYTPMNAIGKHCFECSGWMYKEREECEHIQCPLYPYRLGKSQKVKPKYTTIKAIRQFCIECTSGIYKERELCPAKECYLYPYRLGKNPSRKGVGNTKFSGHKKKSAKMGSVK
jgi:hypothetical protein